MKRHLGLLACVIAWSITGSALAAPVLRVQFDQRGDFTLFGNTLAHDCGSGGPAPIVGTVGLCGTSTVDTSPDVFWRSDSLVAGQAQADTTIAPSQARSTAVLTLPAGATVTYARIYWGGYLPSDTDPADNSIVLERPGTFSMAITADQTWVNGDQRYQGTADITSVVQSLGAGAYRVGGLNIIDLRNLASEDPFAAWSVVVFYELDTEPQRNLALFDGFDFVLTDNNASASLSGFRVPDSGFDGKLGVIAYEGDTFFSGDSLLFNGTALSNAVNPADNFFNGSRSTLGVAVSNPGDLPRLTGGANSMSGLDLDVLDITALLSAGDTTASIEARTVGDFYFLGAFITSISTLAPEFGTSTKTVLDLNEGGVRPGDQLEYRLTVTNTGFDASQGTILTDPLPVGVTFVPGSLEIASGPNAGALTDAAGDDQGEYDGSSRTVTVRLGTGANGTQGGVLDPGQTTVVVFRVTIDESASGTISNQATIVASGVRGAPTTNFVTDGDPVNPGSQPTDVDIDACLTDADCSAPTPRCDTVADPNRCVQCLSNDDCSGNTPTCDTTTGTCVACTGDGPPSCTDAARPACHMDGPLAGSCNECSSSNSDLCQGTKPQCLSDLGICGCTDADGDSECGSLTSGMVCSGAAGMCISGCSVTPGRNGCPTTQYCDNQTGAIGTCQDQPCNSDADCTTSPLLRCNLNTTPHMCVECVTNDHCDAPLVCGETGRCVECTPTNLANCSPEGNGGACLNDGTCGCVTDSDCGGVTSGRVCDTAMNKCMDGCRGTGGNGCPTNRVCTSTTSDIGQCVVCTDNSHCSGATPYCNPNTQTCVACIGDGPPSCTEATRPACQMSGPLAGMCTECSSSNQTRCTGARRLCDLDRGVCVACRDNSDCSGSTPLCDQTSGTCVPCREDGAPSCTDPTMPACQRSGSLAGMCTECSSTNRNLCTGAKPACLTDQGICVGCVDSSQCSGTRPYCDPVQHECVPCIGDGPPSCPTTDRPACLPSGACGCQADSDCGPIDSGRVCDTEAAVCRDGCRGPGEGNQCPSDALCTSSGPDIGQCVAFGDGGKTRITGGYGTCTTTGPGAVPWLVTLLVGLWIALRRVRRSNP